MLAVKVLQAQNIEVTGICFVSNFFSDDKARNAAIQLNIELITPDMGDDLLELVKNPPSGYGKNMNPCLDCHAMMIRKAGRIAEEKGFDIIATGEVLGQRPFSQNKDALARVQKLAGVEILRPLCAKHLPETKYEKDNKVIRGRLLAIQGRQRDEQMELAKKYGIKEYPSPAGGCLLTDPEFSKRLLELIEAWPDADNDDVELIKNGRIYWLQSQDTETKTIVVIGRKESDNDNLEKLVKNGDIMLKLEEIPSPNVLIRSKKRLMTDIKTINIYKNDIKLSELGLNEDKNQKETVEIAAKLLIHYSKKAPERSTINIYQK